jgi:hypothetical protein
VPFTIHAVLTENGVQFTDRACDKYAFHHLVDRVCDENDVGHRLTKMKHPWTDGQVARMNRTLTQATAKRYHQDGQDQLRQHLADPVVAYNFGRRRETLGGLTPYEAICKARQNEPIRFTSNPHHLVPGPNTQAHLASRRPGSCSDRGCGLRADPRHGRVGADRPVPAGRHDGHSCPHSATQSAKSCSGWRLTKQLGRVDHRSITCRD